MLNTTTEKVVDTCCRRIECAPHTPECSYRSQAFVAKVHKARKAGKVARASRKANR